MVVCPRLAGSSRYRVRVPWWSEAAERTARRLVRWLVVAAVVRSSWNRGAARWRRHGRGAEGVGGQEAEGTTVGSDIDEGVAEAESVAREGAQVRLPHAEQVLVALDDVAGGDVDLVAGRRWQTGARKMAIRGS